MNFEHTEDRRMLADTLNRFVAEQVGIEARNRIAYGHAGRSPELWQQFAELGAIGALFPEADGGFGGAGLIAPREEIQRLFRRRLFRLFPVHQDE